MTSVLFRCPKTRLNAQRWMDDAPDAPADSFEWVECPACAMGHFINRRTHKLFCCDEAAEAASPGWRCH